MKLEDWLRARQKTPTDFAREIEVDVSSITRLLPGEKRQMRKPGRSLMSKIYVATAGEVSANDYLDVGSSEAAA